MCNIDILIAVFTAGVVERKPHPQFHPEAPPVACVFQQQGVDKLEFHTPKHGLAVGREALVEVVVSVKPLQGMVNVLCSED